MNQKSGIPHVPGAVQVIFESAWKQALERLYSTPLTPEEQAKVDAILRRNHQQGK